MKKFDFSTYRLKEMDAKEFYKLSNMPIDYEYIKFFNRQIMQIMKKVIKKIKG